MLDLGIEAVKRYHQIAYYGSIWLVEFRDYSTVLVIEEDPLQLDEDKKTHGRDPWFQPQENYIVGEELCAIQN
jgi:hypothetical protein